MADFDDARWYLAGHIVRGIGRTWLCQAFGMSHIEPADPLYMSAPTLASAKRWIRDTLEVPVHYKVESDRLIRVYCLDKYVEQTQSYDEETETWS